MVVLLGTGLPTTLTTAVAMGGAKTVKVFESLASASEYAENTYHHPMQRVVGGEREPNAEVRSLRFFPCQGWNQAGGHLRAHPSARSKRIGPSCCLGGW
jgi:hypothetical protein